MCRAPWAIVDAVEEVMDLSKDVVVSFARDSSALWIFCLESV